MLQAAELIRQRSPHRPVAVAEGAGGDSSNGIKVAMPFVVTDPATFSTHQGERVAVVGPHHSSGWRLNDASGFGRCFCHFARLLTSGFVLLLKLTDLNGDGHPEWVIQVVGLEPTRVSPPHFECGASTNSATPAHSRL